DDGSPLGSWENKECAIDALAQAWSVLSGVATPARAEQVMDAVEEHLIRDRERMIRLLTPPFVDTPEDPGYIKGYVAGVRENGGQYTHAALWVVRAMAALGRRHRATALLEMINPVSHASTPEQVERYQVEPYVMAADVYGNAPHIGRGGWTWYTGSSGWMLRVALESVLGLRAEGKTLVVAPCVPDDWPEYSITWRVPPLDADPGDDTPPADEETRYEIHVANPDHCSEAVVAVTCDDDPCPPVDGTARVPLLRDGRTHRLAITLGPVPEIRP
ncbi:MAG: glycosyl transferase, partial [Gemmatimonadales bacterium]